MVEVLAHNWWAILIRGLAAILFGVIAFLMPGAALFALVILFGAYALVDGVFAIVAAIRAARARTQWVPLLLAGICGIVVAGLTFFFPGLTALTLLYIIAFWALATGLLEIVAGFQLRRDISNEFWWILAGIVSIAFGALLLWRPGAGALAVIWVIATYAIVFGIFLLGLAFRLHGYLGRLEHAGSST